METTVEGMETTVQAGGGGGGTGLGAEPTGAVAGEQLSLYAEGAPSSIPDVDVDTIATKVFDGEQTEQPRDGAATATATCSDGDREGDGSDGDREGDGSDGDREARRGDDGATLRTLSYTSLSELERCGYRYYLERVLGLPEDRTAARTRSGARRARGACAGNAHPPADGVARLRAAARDLARGRRRPSHASWGCASERGEREEIARLIAAAGAAEPAARVAAAGSVRREHPFAFSLGAQRAADHRRDRPARERGDGGAARPRLQERPGRRGGRPGGAGRSATTRSSACSTRWRCCAEAPRASRSSTGSSSARASGSSVRYTRARYRAGSKRVWRSRAAAPRGRAFSVSPQPHRGLCLTCPGTGRPVLVERERDAARAACARARARQRPSDADA